jgi:outer membrane protein OmpA-like peptidoglycan-associated protein
MRTQVARESSAAPHVAALNKEKGIRNMRKLVVAPVAAIVAALVIGCGHEVKIVAQAPSCPQPAPAVIDPPAPPPPAPAPVAEKIAVPGEVQFASGSARIQESKESLETLYAVVKVLNEHSEITKLRIEGHTDNVGYSGYNQRLSQRRADAVASWLGSHGIDTGRLVTAGFGETRPIVSNDSSEHRHMNRRTEFHVQELDGKPYTDDTTPSSPTASSSGATASST